MADGGSIVLLKKEKIMKSNSMITKAAYLMLMASATTSAFAQKMNIEHKGDTTIIKVENPTKYLLLPIQEECWYMIACKW